MTLERFEQAVCALIDEKVRSGAPWTAEEVASAERLCATVGLYQLATTVRRLVRTLAVSPPPSPPDPPRTSSAATR